MAESGRLGISKIPTSCVCGGAQVRYFDGGGAYLDELDGLLGRGIHFCDLDSRSVLSLGGSVGDGCRRRGV